MVPFICSKAKSQKLINSSQFRIFFSLTTVLKPKKKRARPGQWKKCKLYRGINTFLFTDTICAKSLIKIEYFIEKQ